MKFIYKNEENGTISMLRSASKVYAKYQLGVVWQDRWQSTEMGVLMHWLNLWNGG